MAMPSEHVLASFEIQIQIEIDIGIELVVLKPANFG